MFSALLRARRGFGFRLAVSSGQELVTTAAAYARYALSLPETRVLALVLEAIRDAAELRAVLADALAADVPVVLLSVGASAAGQALVSAHSGALAAADGAWEALAGAYGAAPRPRPGRTGRHPGAVRLGPRPGWPPLRAGTAGIATVHDSGLERAHVADLAAELGVPFAAIGPATRDRLAAVLDPGLAPANPLDVWGTGRDAEQQFAECLTAMADDPAVAAVALAVDLVPEFDGDESYPQAVLAAAARTAKPVAVLAGLPAAVDPVAAARLRAAGVPVLEGTRTGLLALRHLLDHAEPPEPRRPALIRPAHRQAAGGKRWLATPAAWAAPYCPACCATTGSRRCASARPLHPRRGPVGGRRDRVSGRAEDRRAGDRAQVGRRRRPARADGPAAVAAAYGTWPPGSARGCWSARPPPPGPSWSSASSATPRSGRSSSSAPGEC